MGDFYSQPRLSTRIYKHPSVEICVRETLVPTNADKRLALEQEISSLIEKRAVRLVPPVEQFTGFLPSFFLTPKKAAGEWRLIINLKPLNKFVKTQAFPNGNSPSSSRVVPHTSVGNVIRPKRCIPTCSHLPRSLPISTFLVSECFLPRVFTRVVRAVASRLRRENLMIFMYLDDCLIVGKSKDETAQDLRDTYTLTTRLGFIINEKRSQLIPSQEITFLEAEIDLRRGLAVPTGDRITSLQECVKLFLSAQVTPAQVRLKLLGFTASLVDLVPWCRLRMRPLQMHLLAHYRPQTDPISLLVSIDEVIRPHLRWWLLEQNCGQSFPRGDPHVIISTDASNEGWGVSLPPRQAAGTWDNNVRSLLINVLELQAVVNALHHFQADVVGRSVLIKTDNTTMVVYINKQGGTRSPQLCYLTWEMFQWLIRHKADLRAIHIPGAENDIADSLSRGKVIHTECSLNKRIVSQIFSILGRPHIDLFASAINTQLPVFCSRSHHPQAWASDAHSIDWTNMFAYAFPLISILTMVIGKLERDRCKILLIAPFWPRQPWVLRLVRLLVGSPLSNPPRSSRPTPSTSVPVPTPGSVRSPPSVLATVKRAYRSVGLSEDAAALAAKGRRLSTQRIYDSRLRHYRLWIHSVLL
ncbi:uncharacterized protein LOC119727789 [Patiria miniata]|uniref:Reverse transcriptase domain-containing protein n=1 Tax=Patiria miniata TaxID=46514 RepID=A0A913ZW82_PATMI|nr:uncharacterized protein LOC119727789 [Patiria miniata]